MVEARAKESCAKEERRVRRGRKATLWKEKGREREREICTEKQKKSQKKSEAAAGRLLTTDNSYVHLVSCLCKLLQLLFAIGRARVLVSSERLSDVHIAVGAYGTPGQPVIDARRMVLV